MTNLVPISQPAFGGLDDYKTTNSKVTDAAHDFESLLLSQMLKQARHSDGWLTGDGEQSENQMMDFAEDQLAQLLARGGALGLTNLIRGGLEANQPTNAQEEARNPVSATAAPTGAGTP